LIAVVVIVAVISRGAVEIAEWLSQEEDLGVALDHDEGVESEKTVEVQEKETEKTEKTVEVQVKYERAIDEEDQEDFEQHSSPPCPKYVDLPEALFDRVHVVSRGNFE
jgi:hypothetical protein